MRVVFVSYDGALDPLGRSQVLPYLEGLARRGVATTLVSFEKAAHLVGPERGVVARQLADAGIGWRPLRYHLRPRVPATLWDVARGAWTVAREAGRTAARIVHARGDVAMLMARWAARRPRGPRLLYEARGLFSDERTEIGSWRRGGLLDRVVRSVETANLNAADGVLVVMSEAGRAELARRRTPLPPHRVLNNSVDLHAFTPRETGEAAEFGLAYCGSLGGWYMTAEMTAFARVASEAVPGRVLVLTPDVEEARHAGFDASWAEVRSVPAPEVPGWLRRATASFFLIRPTPAKRASSPTKVAEALACGLPIVANAGVGDLDAFLEQERVGVLLRGFAEEAYRDAARRLAALLGERQVAARCRRLAEGRFGLEAAVAAYHDLYVALATGGAA